MSLRFLNLFFDQTIIAIIKHPLNNIQEHQKHSEYLLAEVSKGLCKEALIFEQK